MPRLTTRRPAARTPHSKKQLAILKALEETARRTGLRVSAGQLRYAGLRLKGGSCLLRGRRWLILDRAQPFDDLMEIFRQVLSAGDLAASGLPRECLALLAPYWEAEAAALAPEGEA